MKNKEFQRRMTYDVLILLGMFTLVMFMCRLWPIILLCILGAFGAMIRLLFLSRKEAVVIQPASEGPIKRETKRDFQQLAFELAIRRITELVSADYPQARWVWKSAQAKEDLQSSRDLPILLNHAGGYREATVHIQNLQVTGISYFTSAQTRQEQQSNSSSEETSAELEHSENEPEAETEPMPVNYELLAFEWVDAHVLELNGRCNECIANGETELILSADDLPDSKSWENICTELKRNGISACEPIQQGIKIYFKQKNCRKE